MTSVLQENLDSVASEQIVKLFPKCRPRDINLNPVLQDDSNDNILVMMEAANIDRCSVEQEPEDEGLPEDTTQQDSESEDDDDDDVVIDHTESDGDVIVLGKGGTYKLRDSRIIEIAGGREVFSHSRSRAVRKAEAEKKQRAVWELRQGRGSEGKKARNGREVTETVFSSEVRSVRHSRTVNGASPPAINSGEVVVFDDIGEEWRKSRGGHDTSSGGASTPSPTTHHRNAADFFKAVTSASDLDADSLSPEHNNKVARVIGSLPIAEYEGSPRRYGPRQLDVSHPVLPSAQSLLASPSVYPPRPGFPQRILPDSEQVPNSTSPSPGAFDYLYEFSETRKVLEEFFKCPPETTNSFQELEYELRRQAAGSAYVGQRLAKGAAQEVEVEESPRRLGATDGLQESQLDLSVADTGSTEDLGDTEVGLQVGHSRNFTLSPETTDCDSNCGDLDSEASLLMESGPTGTEGNSQDNTQRLCSSMPVLEDGLSSGHASDTDNNPTALLMKRQICEIEREMVQRNKPSPSPGKETVVIVEEHKENCYDVNDPELEALDPLAGGTQATPPPPAPQPHRSMSLESGTDSVEAAIKDIRLALQRTKTLPLKSPPPEASTEGTGSPVWIPRRRSTNEVEQRKTEEGLEEEEADTDLETDRLLGQQRTDDHGFFDDKTTWRKPKTRTVMPMPKPSAPSKQQATPSPSSPSSGIEPAECDAAPDTSPSSQGENITTVAKVKKDKETNKKKSRNKEVMIHEPAVLIEGVLFRANYLGSTQLVCEGQPTKTTRMNQAEEAVSRIKQDQHLAGCRGTPPEPSPQGSMFRLQFLGSVEVQEEGGRRRRKRLKKHMVEEAVTKIKAPEGETQPSTEVDLFISTEKIMVLNTDLKEIMMDHALRTISYIADIGDLVVLMARRRFVPHDVDEPPKINRTPKMICHVFESEEAQFIAQSIGQAFQVAYMEFLKANGIEDHSFVKEMDYQEVLNSQEIFGDELQMFAKKEMQKEVVVPKAKGEILGVVIVESGWGSMLPTVVIANLAPSGAAARCGQLNIGDQIIAINGVSLVGLPLSTCQTYIKNTKNQTVVKLTVVPCAPVVEVKIKRPDTKYQLGFSVQNGVICSLLRGGIAERGGVRVGHRIIEINNQSVVAVPHEKIVNLLATSVGEILMKTMPTSMFRLLTGQETPVYI